MSYTALYRKFRPNTFDEVKGQDAITITLKNQIKAERTSHAYLFCGTRGTGKTSVAKILAKAVNCEHPVDGSPCGTCTLCKAIAAGVSMNVIEIDAASNNGVDNIREIVEEVRYSPTEGRYKVYIIDEVHMLSAGAFNALLKTLEEPPSYVMFILATTEVHKIPITILSRCQRYDFKRITPEEITARMADLLEREHVSAEEKALRYIAKAADGSMRDALSLLDQCLAFYMGETLTYDQVLEVLGTVDTEVFSSLLSYIRMQDVTGALRMLEDLVMRGRDLSQFVVDFTWYLRNLLLVGATGQADFADIATDKQEAFLQEAKEYSAETLMRYIHIFSELTNQLRYAAQKRILLEVAITKLCCPQMETDYAALLDRVRQLEEKIEHGIVAVQAAGSETKQETTAKKDAEQRELEKAKEQVIEKAVGEELQLIANNWNAIVGKLSGMLKFSMMNAKPSVGNNDTLLLVLRDEFDKSVIDTPTHLEDIQKTVLQVTGKTVDISVVLAGKGQQQSYDAYPDLTKIKEKVMIEYVD